MTLYEMAVRLRAMIEKNAQTMTDEESLEYSNQFGRWHPDMQYETGLKLRYNDVLYKVLQNHTSQESWTPDVTPSLYARVLIENPNIIPEWEQPDSTNAYMRGDKVTHNNKTWESLIDNNVWEPGAIGTENLWQEVV